MPLQNDPNTYVYRQQMNSISRHELHQRSKSTTLGRFIRCIQQWLCVTICTAVQQWVSLHYCTFHLSTPLSTNSFSHKKHRSHQRNKVMQCTAGIETEAGFSASSLASNRRQLNSIIQNQRRDCTIVLLISQR